MKDTLLPKMPQHLADEGIVAYIPKERIVNYVSDYIDSYIQSEVERINGELESKVDEISEGIEKKIERIKSTLPVEKKMPKVHSKAEIMEMIDKAFSAVPKGNEVKISDNGHTQWIEVDGKKVQINRNTGI
jgi:hypothetical protein